MSNGMRIDPRDLPLHMQEQVGVALAAQMAQTNPVAGREEVREKVPVRRLRFTSARAAKRYLDLRILAKTGIISDLVLRIDGKHVRSFTYLVVEETE